MIGGVGVDANALLPHLGPPLSAQLLGVLRLAPRKVGAAEIRERSLELLVGSGAARLGGERWRSWSPCRARD